MMTMAADARPPSAPQRTPAPPAYQPWGPVDVGAADAPPLGSGEEPLSGRTGGAELLGDGSVTWNTRLTTCQACCRAPSKGSAWRHDGAAESDEGTAARTTATSRATAMRRLERIQDSFAGGGRQSGRGWPPGRLRGLLACQEFCEFGVL